MRRYLFFNKLIFALLVLALGSCTSEDFWDSFDRTVDGAIDFTVGVEGAPARRALTRAAGDASYYALQPGTQLRLKVDGMWKRVSETEPVAKQTTCQAEVSETAVNTLKYEEGQTLYWDDYGTGDPENAENKDKGLKVLAVAVDGKTAAPEIAAGEWESKTWSVVTDGKDVFSGDILVSNNLIAYTFVSRNDADAKKMIFKHPLSKITFNIKAGQGFTNGFENDPVLTLSNATTLEGISDTQNDYALATGKVSIQNGTATSDGTKAKVIAGTISAAAEKKNVVKAAIVYPGTQLGSDDNTVIGVLQADGNIYYIKAKEIHDKMTEHANFETKPGYNYIINITVNKTGIRTTATVVDWNKVETEEIYPEINVTLVIGAQGSKPASGFNGFDFWRSETINKSYQHEATPTVATDGTTSFGEHTLYWTHHNQHYHFRGIYPTGTSVTTDTKGNQVVAVENGSYNASTFPSNFVMGMPEFGESNYLCKNEDHESVDMRTAGICARTSAINLNFRYMMSQVEVNLTSSESSAANYVDLTHAEVELVNVGTKGHILLSNRSAVVTDEGTFTLPCTSGNNYHGVIFPQTLVNGDKSNKVQFKITVYADTQKTKKSVYYADVAPIKVKANGGTAKATNVWEAGVHYVYNLNITKTQINATATLTDWTTVAASEDVWF